MNGQCGVVPGRSVRELVVGQHVSSGLRLGQVLEPDDRDFGALIEFRRLVAAMAGYDLLVPVEQNRRVEAEGGNAAGDCPDLLAAVLARIGRIGLELHDRKESEPATLRRRCAAYRKLFLYTRFQPGICNIRHRSSLLRRRLRGADFWLEVFRKPPRFATDLNWRLFRPI